jgi:hypothetical protein
VSWHKATKKWQAKISHQKKQYYGGCFKNEKHAAMAVNLLCDEREIGRKNPTIDIDLDQIQQVIYLLSIVLKIEYFFFVLNREFLQVLS